MRIPMIFTHHHMIIIMIFPMIFPDLPDLPVEKPLKAARGDEQV